MDGGAVVILPHGGPVSREEDTSFVYFIPPVGRVAALATCEAETESTEKLQSCRCSW